MPALFKAASESEIQEAHELATIVAREGSAFPELAIEVSSERFFKNPYGAIDLSTLKFGRTEILQQIEGLCDLVSNRRLDVEEESDFGPYVGICGISLALYRAAQLIHRTNPSKASQLLQIANELQASTVKHSIRSSNVPRFLLGKCGFLTVNLLTDFQTAHTKNQIAELEQIGRHFATSHDEPDELFCGRCGFLAAALTLRQEKRTELAESVVQGVLASIINSGVAFSRHTQSPSPLMFQYHSKRYFGAAHGICGIVQMLLNFHDSLDEYQIDLVRGTVDWLATTQSSDGNFPSSACHIGEPHHRLVHWCHGAPGFALLFLSSYRVFGDEKYLRCTEDALKIIWDHGFLRKGPGLCHGLSGNGYIFLLAYRHTKRPEFYHKARAFGYAMFSERFQRLANTPDCPFSLFEGWAGPICFLADLLEPQKAQFPLYPLRDYHYLP
ncbi:hypothetical protein L596_014730 [Steinernema carpocapsae]|uniref:LanC-like protein 3 homolog n=1 Tax=Steinernema carpocapsae TaxID=34508 RepID=A0A4U5NDK7_STECR|nr:hypothetical protein L596_014730 [Steinernema carpocapsae]